MGVEGGGNRVGKHESLATNKVDELIEQEMQEMMLDERDYDDDSSLA